MRSKARIRVADLEKLVRHAPALADDADELAVGRRGIVVPEDRAARDEQVGAGVARGADGLAVDSAVDLHPHVGGQQRAQPRDPLERVRHERLARVAGMDRHAEHEIGALGRGDRRPRPPSPD